MTTATIDKILDQYLTDLDGRSGFWRGIRDEVQLFVLSDDSHDRMRIMAPIGELDEIEPELLQVLLQANYDRALDARYAMRGKEVWSVSVHPLATLAPDDFASFLDQVVRLVKNTGTTFASSDLMFGSSDGDESEGEGEGGEGGGTPGGEDAPPAPEGTDDE